MTEQPVSAVEENPPKIGEVREYWYATGQPRWTIQHFRCTYTALADAPYEERGPTRNEPLWCIEEWREDCWERRGWGYDSWLQSNVSDGTYSLSEEAATERLRDQARRWLPVVERDLAAVKAILAADPSAA